MSPILPVARRSRDDDDDDDDDTVPRHRTIELSILASAPSDARRVSMFPRSISVSREMCLQRHFLISSLRRSRSDVPRERGCH